MKAINLKSGKEYKVLHPSVIDAANAREGELLVVYTDTSNTLYARESVEFYQKFKILNEVKTDKQEVCHCKFNPQYIKDIDGTEHCLICQKQRQTL